MKTFTSRTTFWFSSLVTLTTAVLLLVGGALLHRQLIHSIELMHDVEGDEIAGLIGPHHALNADQLARRISEDTDSDVALFQIQVRDEKGAIIYRSPNLGAATLPEAGPEETRSRAVADGLGPLWVSVYPAGPWRVQIASRLAPVNRVLRGYAQVSAILLIAAAAMSVVLGYGFSRYLLKPIKLIEATARRIRSDNLSERIPVPPGNDELAALARLLNQTFDRLQTAFAQVQRFTADASHELKTPLALIRLNAEKLRPAVAHDTARESALDDLLDEITRLHRIIEHLLFLSKADGGALSLQMRPFAIQPWLADFAQDAQALAEDSGHTFQLVRSDEGELTGEPHLLRQLLLNLLSNALQAMPQPGTVTLESLRQNGRWFWRMHDEGPGLPDDKLELIFERFVRLAPQSGVESASGHGLGLAICRSIMALHRGTVRAKNRADRSGLILIVEFPEDVSSPLSDSRASSLT